MKYSILLITYYLLLITYYLLLYILYFILSKSHSKLERDFEAAHYGCAGHGTAVEYFVVLVEQVIKFYEGTDIAFCVVIIGHAKIEQ